MNMNLDINAETYLPFDALFVGRVPELRALTEHFAGNHRLAQITGDRGTGKTALAMMFAHQANDLFPGGATHLHAFPPQPLHDLIVDAIHLPLKRETLVIVDDLDLAPKAEIISIHRVLDEHPLLNALLVGQVPVDFPDATIFSLSLSGLDQASFDALIRRRLQYMTTDADLIAELYHRARGNPLLADAANRSIRDGIVTLREFLLALRNFDYRPIIGPDGRPISEGLAVPRKVVVAATVVNAELLTQLKNNPQLLRKLSPRKFEEVVAELLEQQGYSVELTPASRDGGFDMYVAKNEALGQFLYLVECKRYSPPNKVGVQIVRALHGVVQQTRATAGIIATTSFFTDGAKEFQQEVRHQLHLRDYVELQKWLGIVK